VKFGILLGLAKVYFLQSFNGKACVDHINDGSIDMKNGSLAVPM